MTISRRPARSLSFHAVAAFSLLPVVFSCGGGGGGTEVETIGSVTIEESAFDLPIRATQLIKAVVKDMDGNTLPSAAVAWSSSAPQVVQVDAIGQVTAVAEGTASITARAEGKSAAVSVSVIVLDFVAIAAGGNHTCGLTDTGQAWCWGDRPVKVETTLSFAAIEAGDYSTCALTGSGKAYCWGQDVGGEGHATPTAEPGDLTFAAFTVASGHRCGITGEGKAYCRGMNSSGQLGNKSNVASDTFVPVFGPVVFQLVRVGAQHTCGIGTDGATYCWGANENGLLGTGDRKDRDSPSVVTGGLSFQTLASGSGSFVQCGVAGPGDAYCWGYWGYLFGESQSEAERRDLPTLLPGGVAFESLTSGPNFVCGISAADQGYCLGANAYGQLGDGTTSLRETPIPISGSHSWKQITAGYRHVCGLTTGGRVYCWGQNNVGQLGSQVVDQQSNIPLLVHGSH